ncbi:hypothetical protein [Amycolatopsis sp. MJM2582]|uniref:hypothetical protein n=1 Tax=Amycolatopsis sp. MJM2582 TaxID=1427749 RepID=UPI00126A293C|nr:hypothetical protein [Amycolatopsis sp. MJM2582]
MIAALVPDSTQRHPQPARLPALPEPRLPVESGPDLLIGAVRIDRTGRVNERLLFRALGWHPGRRLSLDTLHGLIVIAPDPSGQHVIDARGALTLPAAARHMCGIEPDRPLVLAASIHERLLIVHPGTTVARLLTEHYRDITGLDHDA